MIDHKPSSTIQPARPTPATTARRSPAAPGGATITIRDAEELALRDQSRFMKWLRGLSGSFWREFMYFWTARAPGVVLWTRPFFLWFAYRYSAVLRDGPQRNARRILGPKASEASVEALRRDIILNGYLNVYELGASVKRDLADIRARIEEVEGHERYLAARAEHRGAILVTAHFGPFEAGMVALLDIEKSISVVFRRDERASFDRIRTRLRARLGIREMPVDEGWNVWVRLRDALHRDEVVLIQGDRVMPGQRGVRVPFLDGHIRVPTGPVKLAKATGSPLVPIFTVRTQVGKLKVVIEEPIHVADDQLPVDGEHPAVRHIVRALEKQVRANPAQWTVYYRAWCEDENAD